MFIQLIKTRFSLSIHVLEVRVTCKQSNFKLFLKHIRHTREHISFQGLRGTDGYDGKNGLPGQLVYNFYKSAFLLTFLKFLLYNCIDTMCKLFKPTFQVSSIGLNKTILRICSSKHVVNGLIVMPEPFSYYY